MTDYKEEQMMEVEALESIYMDEFTKISDEPLSYSIHIVPNQDGQDNHVAMTLQCVIPETYPDVEPTVELVLNKGLSDTHRKELQALVLEQVAENMGMAMMFTICEAIREYLLDNNSEGHDGSEYQEMMRRLAIQEKKDGKIAESDAEKAAAILEKKPKDYGTPVTVESFMAWRAKFEAEKALVKTTTTKDEATAKLTGRKLWNTGLVKDEDAEGEDDIDDEEEEGEDDEEEDEQEGDTAATQK